MMSILREYIDCLPSNKVAIPSSGTMGLKGGLCPESTTERLEKQSVWVIPVKK